MANSSFATGGFHGTRYQKETVFGEIPDPINMKILRHTSNALILSKETFQSEELRDDSQISDLRHGNKQASGDIGFEFSFEEYDDFLQAAIRSDGWQNDTVSGNDYLVAGVTPTSFLIERSFRDIGQYESFTGCMVSTMTLAIAPNAMVTGTLSMVGKDINFATTSLDPTPIPATANSPYDGFRGSLKEGGSEIAVVTAIELSIDNAIEPAFVIGSDTAEALLSGRINITGTISAYFQNMDLLQKFVNETESSLEFGLGDGTKNSYLFTLPRIKYSGGENPVDGEGAITLSMPFQALLDPCTGTNIRIDRIAGPADPDCAITWSATDFTESATVPGTFDTVITGTLAGGSNTKTLNGTIGEALPGVTPAPTLPDGITLDIKKASATEIELRLSGTATAAVTATTFDLVIASQAFAFGFCYCPNDDVTGREQTFTITPAA